jgi:low affinity Fe/Cu permease
MKRLPRHNGHRKPRKEYGGFQRFARMAARVAGRPIAFGIAFGAILVWGILGPIFHFSDTWQLVINTATTIVTFLMVFLIQNTQNRDSEAVQIKLDELLRATKGCHNAVLDIEELSEEELDEIKRGYTILARKALDEIRKGKSDLGIPEMEPQLRAHERS